jgi:hypothetical protein
MRNFGVKYEVRIWVKAESLVEAQQLAVERLSDLVGDGIDANEAPLGVDLGDEISTSLETLTRKLATSIEDGTDPITRNPDGDAHLGSGPPLTPEEQAIVDADDEHWDSLSDPLYEAEVARCLANGHPGILDGACVSCQEDIFCNSDSHTLVNGVCSACRLQVREEEVNISITIPAKAISPDGTFRSERTIRDLFCSAFSEYQSRRCDAESYVREGYTSLDGQEAYDKVVETMTKVKLAETIRDAAARWHLRISEGR